MSHRDICIAVAAWVLSQPHTGLVAWEIKLGRSILDVLGVSTKRSNDPRITVCECKRTRSDLLSDLKKQKLLKYQTHGTHYYLAATPEALRLDKLSTSEVLGDLHDRLLPVHWGVLSVASDGFIRVLRAAKRHRPTPGNSIVSLTKKMARQHMYNRLRDLGIIT